VESWLQWWEQCKITWLVSGQWSTERLDPTRLRREPWSPDRGGMRVSSEALAKEDWSFGGLRRTTGATGSCPWGST